MAVTPYRILHRFKSSDTSRSKYRGVLAQLPHENVILLKDDFDRSKPSMTITNNAEAVVSEIVADLSKNRLKFHTLSHGTDSNGKPEERAPRIYYMDTQGSIELIVPTKWRTSDICEGVDFDTGEQLYLPLFEGV